MDLRPEEWAVLNLLASSRAIDELCASSQLGDFVLCQLLWGLQTLGVARRAGEPQRTAADALTSALVSLRPAAPLVDDLVAGDASLPEEAPAAAGLSGELTGHRLPDLLRRLYLDRATGS